MNYCCYILYSQKHDKTYVGFTQDLISRFHSHNTLSPKGWTKKFRPWIVIHVEFFEDKRCALRREKQLKSGQGRAWIRAEILSKYR